MDFARFAARAALLFASIAVINPGVALGFSFSPSTLEFTLGSGETSQTFTAVNPGDSKIAVQVSAHRREVDEEGKETLPATDHFTVFPKQLVLEPKQSKPVRITYVGPKTLSRESAYRIVAEQLPIDLKSVKQTEGMNLKFLIKYQTSVYVSPSGAKPAVKIESARAVSETPEAKDGKRQLELTLVNEGTAHWILEGATLKLKGADGKAAAHELSGEKTRALETVNLLPGGRRKVLLPWPPELPSGAYTGTVEFN